MSRWMSKYIVHCDFRPFQEWQVEAESESEARLIVCKQLNVPYEETSASLAK
jgi:hypothetical protein